MGAKFQVIFLCEDNPIKKQLKELDAGTEVTIHTEDESFYEVSFQGFDEETGAVNLEVDQFYPEGSHDVSIEEKDIVSLQTPDSKVTSEEDEIE
ncbi:hypothetical protein [Bacillus sp. FJAT-47783]|uniref:hypothetical protein n=1 Tax=Bacillus sp. FJAT-47783 TaxID=2922712 RepID=UPI001FAC15A0|nr:hypothetical protein [Bacillus sp. FJAT-47783]